jgi:hypothetical protein
MGPTGCPVLSVNKYQRTLRNTPEAQRPQVHRGGSLKSRKLLISERRRQQVPLIGRYLRSRQCGDTFMKTVNFKDKPACNICERDWKKKSILCVYLNTLQKLSYF